MIIRVHFSLLIPRMSIFTLAISCLTTSNLPWFMDLTLQVPVQYCSLQHRTLLLSPVTSTIGYCFCFGSIPSFFLELFLHWSPVAYWAPTDLRSSSFSVLSFCLFVLSLAAARRTSAAERSYPKSKIRSSACTGGGGLRGATPRSRSGGAAVRRYPSFKVRETEVRW